MGTKQYDSATDLITFSRASGGTALSKISYSNDELVTNGTFDTDATGWVGNNSHYSPTIETQRLKVITGASGQWNYANASMSGLTIGKSYRFQASSFVGTATRHRISLGTASGQSYDIVNQGLGVNYSQTVDMTFTATTTVVYVSLQNTDGVDGSTTLFDNISVKEVLFDQADGTLQLFNHGNNIPRIEYDATGAVKGLLIEEARTNVVTNSGDISGGNFSAFVKYNTQSVASGVTVPDGSTDAHLLYPSSSGVARFVYTAAQTLTAGIKQTSSVYMKASGVTTGLFYSSAGGGLSTVGIAWFDLSAGTVGTVVYGYTATIEDVGNGWYRCSVSGYTFNGGYFIVGVADADNSTTVTKSGTDGILVWGAQAETGSFPTSYIPTAGAAATRARDLAEIPTSAFGYNNDKGSLVVDVLTPVANQLMPLATFNTSSYYNSRSLWKSNSGITAVGTDYVRVAHDGVTTKFTIGQQTQAVYTKLGLSYGDSERAVRDGGTVVSGTSRYPNPDRLHLGGRDNGYQSQCWIKSIQYYPRQLTDTQLQELTT